MNDKITGGPAFPSHGTMGEVTCEGMTMRDYFASNASDKDVEDVIFQAFAAAVDIHSHIPPTRQQARYIHADAMLEARNQ